MIALAIVTGASLFVYYFWSKRKQTHETERAKERRGAMYAESLSGLRDAIESMRVSTDQRSKMQNDSIDALNSNVSKLTTVIRGLVHKIDGRMSREDSARFIHHAFERDLYRDICLTVENSLRENDYASRQEYVARKIRTGIGEAMIEVREYLCSYPLAINPNDYFQTDAAVTGERFVLADLVWAVIEKQFRHTSQLQHRIEEAFLLIENTIKDYLAGVYSGIMQDNAQRRRTSGSMKTPLPGRLADPSDSDTHLMSTPTLFAPAGSATSSLIKKRTVGGPPKLKGNDTMSSGSDGDSRT